MNCPYCNKPFSSTRGLNIHIKLKHPGEKTVEPQPGETKSPIKKVSIPVRKPALPKAPEPIPHDVNFCPRCGLDLRGLH